MEDYDYEFTQSVINVIENMAASLDLNAFIERISRTHALAPITQPSLYMRAATNLTHIEAVARKLRELQALTMLFLAEQEGGR